MKILLIFPPIREHDVPRQFPTGIGIIASVLINDGHDVKLLDINGNRFSKEEVVKQINSEDFDVVGIGGLITVYNYVKWLVQEIRKKDSSIPIILGGSVGSSIPILSLEKLHVDIVVDGEGEITASKLFKALEKKQPVDNIPGLWLKKDGKVINTGEGERVKDMDTVPYPAYDLFPMDIYLSNPIVGFGKDIDLITSRGCPYNCIYCYKIGKRYFRRMSVERIINLIDQLKRQYDIDFISFQDNEFMFDKKWIQEFLKQFKEKDYNIKWSCTGRVNLVDKEILQQMKDAGCTSISYGIESGSQKMLDIMRKQVTVEQAIEAINITKEVGLRAPTSFIIGIPGETEETIEETIDFCAKTNIVLTTVMFATPYPNTELYHMSKELGKIPDDLDGLDLFVSKLGDCISFTINLTDTFSDKEIIEKRDYMINKTQENYVPVSPKKMRHQFIDLYGQEIYDKLLEQLKDEKNIEHLKTHGFNDLIDILNAIDEEEKCEC
jgi:radical SAM superfamily enzyme YgiQ (UPF0313 family)